MLITFIALDKIIQKFIFLIIILKIIYYNNKISSIKKSFEISGQEIISNLSYTKDVGLTGKIILLDKIKNEGIINNDYSKYISFLQILMIPRDIF